jgi:hypothetical protein
MKTLFPLAVSSSMMDDMSCRRKWFQKYCRRLIPEGKSIHLVAGGLLASALEKTRKAFFNEGMDPNEAIELGYEFILGADSIQDSLKNNENLAFAFKRYFRKFPLEQANRPCELRDGTYAIEYQFEFDTGIQHPDLTDRNVLITGKLDFLGERRDARGELLRYVHDDKTTQKIYRVAGTKFIDREREKVQYQTRGQFIIYNWAAHKLGIDTVGTVVHRLPLLKEPEDAFELEIECNAFMIKAWEGSFFNEIEELKERYLAVKNGMDPLIAFGASYNHSCFSYNSPCDYMVGCLYAEGDSKLRIDCRQAVGYPEIPNGEEMSLDEYLERLR